MFYGKDKYSYKSVIQLKTEAWGEAWVRPWKRGARDALVNGIQLLLSSRGISLPDESRLRIRRSKDLDELESWLERSAFIEHIDELFIDYTGGYARRLKAEGEAKALLLVLRARGIKMTDQARNRIRACTGFSQLEHWITRAATIDHIDELFAEDDAWDGRLRLE